MNSLDLVRSTPALSITWWWNDQYPIYSLQYTLPYTHKFLACEIIRTHFTENIHFGINHVILFFCLWPRSANTHSTIKSYIPRNINWVDLVTGEGQRTSQDKVSSVLAASSRWKADSVTSSVDVEIPVEGTAEVFRKSFLTKPIRCIW